MGTPFGIQGLRACRLPREGNALIVDQSVICTNKKNTLPRCGVAPQDTVKHEGHEQPQRLGTLADFGAQDCPLKTIEIELGNLLRIEVRPQFAYRLGLTKQARIALPPVGEHGFQLGAEGRALVRELLTQIANQAPPPTPAAFKMRQRLVEMAVQAGEGTLGGLPQPPLETFHIGRRKLRDHRAPKRLFAREIVIEGALGHPRRLQHLLDARMVVPLLQNELRPRVYQGRLRRRLGARTRICCRLFGHRLPPSYRNNRPVSYSCQASRGLPGKKLTRAGSRCTRYPKRSSRAARRSTGACRRAVRLRVSARSRGLGTSSAGSALCLHTGARRGRGKALGGAGDQRRGVESAELLVVLECRDGRLRAAERAVGITPDADLAEPHRQRIVQQQAPDQRL